jgi:predicted negative regulator of RcsB-dependent stress response
MAFEVYDEYEQSEQVVKWLRENAMAIVAGIVLGLLLIFGAQQWRNHQARHRSEAADMYQQLQQAVTAKNQPAIDSLTASLEDKYKDSPFASFAAFGAAQRALEVGKSDQALAALNWAEQHAGDTALKSLATLRIATVQMQAGKPDAAIAALDKLPVDDYRGMAQELRGDALVKLKRTADARRAYIDALAAYGDDARQRPLVQLKLDNLAEATEHGT